LKKPYYFQSQPFSKDDYITYAVGNPIGVLADVGPSILANLGIKQPEEMTGMDLSIAML
jgi:bisphosphoglycerate-independent phosphoglycerate mutase (AlkP superfamily)